MRMCVSAVFVLGLASCGGMLGRSGVSGPQSGTPVLGAARVSIPFYREHYTSREESGGLMSTLAGVGAHESGGERTTIDKVDQLGTVIVDLRSGQCELAAAPAPERASAWDRPVPLDPGAFYDAPGARLYRGDRDLVASIGSQTHVVIDDWRRQAMWLQGTDAIVRGGEVIDIVDGQIWRYDGGTARVGDHLFVPTGQSIVELTVAPVAQLAVYTPEGKVPAAEWVTPVLWKVGDVHRGIALTPQGLLMTADDGHTYVSPTRGAVYWYESLELAQSESELLDLATKRAMTDVPGYPRVGLMVSGNLLLEVGGRYWSGSRRLDDLRGFDSLPMIGFDGEAFVFHQPEHDAILVFDVTTRQWREHRYGRCEPSQKK